MSHPNRTLVALAASALFVGCQSDVRPVPRVAVPQTAGGTAPTKTYEPLRPLRAEEPRSNLPPPIYDDPPLVNQEAPETPAYVDAYNRVGRPRLAVFVNRSMEGALIANDRPSSGGDAYLRAGEYDETQAKQIDYQAIELALADALSAGNRVTLVSPQMTRMKLTDEQVKAMQSGRPQVLREVAESLDADVLVQVQAKPTRQTTEGLGVRILVEAFNTRGGESIARSFVDVPPPLDKPTINRFSRFLSRSTMDALARAWQTEPTRSPTTQP